MRIVALEGLDLLEDRMSASTDVQFLARLNGGADPVALHCHRGERAQRVGRGKMPSKIARLTGAVCRQIAELGEECLCLRDDHHFGFGEGHRCSSSSVVV